MALLNAADDIGLPVLGVCRGMQIMAVTAGGSLIQHVPDVVGTDEHSPGPDVYGAVQVAVEPGSRLAGDHRDRRRRWPATTTRPSPITRVSSAVAHADDGLLEAMETPGDRFRLAVQWHPETQTDRRLFEALVAAAGEWAGSVRRTERRPAQSLTPDSPGTSAAARVECPACAACARLTPCACNSRPAPTRPTC